MNRRPEKNHKLFHSPFNTLARQPISTTDMKGQISQADSHTDSPFLPACTWHLWSPRHECRLRVGGQTSTLRPTKSGQKRERPQYSHRHIYHKHQAMRHLQTICSSGSWRNKWKEKMRRFMNAVIIQGKSFVTCQIPSISGPWSLLSCADKNQPQTVTDESNVFLCTRLTNIKKTHINQFSVSLSFSPPGYWLQHRVTGAV